MHVARKTPPAYRQTMSDWCPRCGRRRPLRTPLTEAVTRLLECGIRFRRTTNRDELTELRAKAATARERIVAAMDAELAAMDALIAATPAPRPAPAAQGNPAQLSFIAPPEEIRPALTALKAGRRLRNVEAAASAEGLDEAEGPANDHSRWTAGPPSELIELGDHLLSA